MTKNAPTTAGEEKVIRLLKRFEEMVPNWRTTFLLEMVSAGLDNLRHYIHDPAETTISWAKPFVEIHHVVRWDFTKEMPEAMGGMTCTEEEDAALDAIKAGNDVEMEAAFMAASAHLRQRLLLDATHGLVEIRDAGARKNDRRRFTVPQPLQDHLDAATNTTVTKDGVQGKPADVARREAMVEALATPFAINAALLHFDRLRGVLPAEQARRLEDIARTLPLLHVVFRKDNGETFTAIPVLAVAPLVVDMKARLAFFPITVGLVFDTEEGQPPVDPARWTTEEEGDFWREVFTSLEAEVERSHTADTSETSTLTPEPAAVARAVEATFPVAFRTAVVDNDVADILGRVVHLNMPVRRWETVPKLADLEAEEVARLTAAHGNVAFGDETHEALLVKRNKSKDQAVVRLAANAKRDLKVRAGLDGNGYRDTEDGVEYLVRVFETPRGFLEIGLSWERMAGPWVMDWREQVTAEAKKAEKDISESLYENLDDDRRKQANRLLYMVNRMGDGWKVLEVVLTQLGATGFNPVRMPAVALRVLLQIENDPHWKSRIDAALECLRGISVRVDGFAGEPAKARGNLVSWWQYQGAGAGSHGEGEYWITVTPQAVGCLKVFESGVRKIHGRDVTRYTFGTLEAKAKIEKAKHDKDVGFAGYKAIDSGSPYYAVAEGLSAPEKALMALLDTEETKRGDTARDYPPGRRKEIQRPPNAKDAKEPRVYDSSFCPLLEPGKTYHAALAHFSRNPEAGWTLGGTSSRATATGGARVGGLLDRMGFLVPPGRESAVRANYIRQALNAMKRVVVDYLEGVVVAHEGSGRWLSFASASSMPERDMKTVKWLFFLPPDWRDIRRRKWEAHQAERQAKGETTHAWKTTSDTKVAETALQALRGQAGVVEVNDDTPGAAGGRGLVLVRHRLRKARLDRGLTLDAIGAMFGVGREAVRRWEVGVEPDEEDGKIHGKPIPHDLLPLIVRWIETNEAPTSHEIQGRRQRPARGQVSQ